MHPISLHRRTLLKLALPALSTLSLAARAQSSGRALSFIVPQPAGNPTDALARKILPALQKALAQTVVVENLPGAGGSIGLSRTLATVGDGQALTIASQTETTLTPFALAGVRYKPEDLRCVAFLGRTPYVLIGRPDLPATNLASLTALVRESAARPLSHGHIGYGSMIHLLGEQWSRQSGLKLNQIPYKGVPPLLQDLMGGQIDLTFFPLAGSTVNLIESGKVRAYGITASAPNHRLPKLPALSQLDPALADFVYETWGAVFVPRSTSEAAAQRLHKALAEALADPDFLAYLSASGVDRSDLLSLAQLDQLYRSEIKLYQDMARKIGITPQ